MRYSLAPGQVYVYPEGGEIEILSRLPDKWVRPVWQFRHISGHIGETSEEFILRGLETAVLKTDALCES